MKSHFTFISFVSFCEPSVRFCSSERSTSVVFLQLSSFLLTRLLADAAALGNRRKRKGPMFVHPTARRCVCDHSEGLMIACVFSRGPCVLLRVGRGAQTHEYLAPQLTVIGYCCEPCGLVCAHCPCIRQQTAAASHPTSDGGLDGFKTTWNKKQCGCNCAQ